MQFFTGCKTKEEATKLFRNLSKCFHPDIGGQSEYMVELIKQYDNWKPEQSFERERIVIQYHYDPNPRVQILERELTRLRRLADNPLLEKQNLALKSSVNYLTDQLKESEKRNLALKSKNYDLENQLKNFRDDKEKINEMMTDLLQENIKLKSAKNDKPDVPLELTLWQKIKYVIGDKCPKSYT